MNIFRTAVNRPVATAMVFTAIVVFGVYSFSRLPVDLFPEMDSPMLSVVTLYPGAGALEVERNVTDPLESALGTVPNLNQITSTSVDDVSTIMLELDWGTNMDEATNDVRDALDRASRMLPDDVEAPMIWKFDAGAIPVAVYAVTAAESYPDLERIIDEQIAGPLNRISGVGDVSISGAPRKQVDVRLDPQRVEAHNLDLQQIARALQAENIISPVGRVDLGRDSYNLRVNTEFRSLDDISQVIVSARGGGTVRLHEVASVAEGFQDKTTVSLVNGRPGIAFMVLKQSDANTVAVANAVNQRLPELAAGLPPDVDVSLIIDTSEFVVEAISNLSSVLFFALLFVVLVVLAFLRRWRATIIVAATIPVSLIVAFIYLAITGSTLNIISLSALSIALGMVVDDAIVVLENIMRHAERGRRPKEAAIHGTGEVGMAVVATTLTVVAVFLPLTFLSGPTGLWFGELGFIVVVTISTSTIAALSLTPMMASVLLRRLEAGKAPPKILTAAYSDAVGRGYSRLAEGYGGLLGWALSHRKTVVGGAIVLLIGTLAMIPTVGTEFMPVSDNGMIRVTGELETSRSLQFTADVAQRVEQDISAVVPELVMVNTTAGGGGMGPGGARSSNQFRLWMNLGERSSRSRSVFEVADQIRGVLEDAPEVVTHSVVAGAGMAGGERPVEVHILGHDLDETGAIAQDLVDHMQSIEGVRDVQSSRGRARPELEFALDRDRLSSFGLTSSSVVATVRGNVAGQTATRYREGGHEYDVVLRYAEEDRSNLAQIEEMSVMTPTGHRVRVRDLGQVQEFMAPPNIERRDRDRVVTVSAGLHERPLNQVMEEIQAWVDGKQLPPQLEIVLGGDFQEQQETFADLFLMLLLSVVLVYLVMAAQFESMRDPFVIMFSVPFAFTGVLLALLLTNTALSVIGFVGAIILVGIVVKNAIVLVDYIKLLRGRGMPVVDAIVQGGTARLRPVLMTTLTTLLAMTPLALNLREGAEMWQPMAISVIGGLLFSTLVTLVLVPVVYSLFESRAERVAARRGRRGAELALGTFRGVAG